MQQSTNIQISARRTAQRDVSGDQNCHAKQIGRESEAVRTQREGECEEGAAGRREGRTKNNSLELLTQPRSWEDSAPGVCACVRPGPQQSRAERRLSGGTHRLNTQAEHTC